MAAIAAERVGYALDADLECVGAVHSVFSRAVNLEIEGEIWTLLASDCADLPFGIRLPVRSLDTFAIRAGGCVHARAGFIGLGRPGRRLVVDCRAAPRWAPVSPFSIASGFPARLALLSQEATALAWRGSRPMARLATSTLQRGAGGLDDALTAIIGRGPGLTPAGDDVLVGILAVLCSPLSGTAGAEAAQAMLRAIRRLAPRTTALSGHMLGQAARGLIGRALHELLVALTGCPVAVELEGTIRRVVKTGATSGADACMGVLEAAQAFLLSAAYETAA